MRTRIVVRLDSRKVGHESEVKRELEGMGVDVESAHDGSGTIVAHADQDALRRVGELRGVQSMQADPLFAAGSGAPADWPPDVR